MNIVSPSCRAHKACLMTLFLLVVCLSILKHPYFGIVHDSILYTVEALNKINSKTYANDFYFLNTYQSRFSITTFIYSKCIVAFGLSAANILLLILGQSLWLAGAYLTTGVFLKGFARFAAMALAVSFPSYYGGSSIFSYFEPFYSPRLLSEAFVLFSVFFWARGMRIVSVSSIVVAFALHPLMAIPGILVLLLLDLRQHKEILWVLVPISLGAIVLAVLGVEPFANIFVVMDGDWLKAVQSRCSFFFISMWSPTDLVWTAAQFMFASIAYARMSGKQKELLGAVIIAALLLNSASFIAGDYLHNVLALQLQLWRSSWLLLFFVAATFYGTASDYCVKGPVGLVVAALLCVYVFDIAIPPYSYMALTLAVVLGVVMRWTTVLNVHWVSCSVRNRIVAYTFVLLSVLFIMKLSWYYSPFQYQYADEDRWRMLTKMLPLLTAFSLMWGRVACFRPKYCGVLLVTAVVATCFCVSIWDRTEKLQRQLFAEDDQTSRIRRVIPDGSLVFWPGACRFTWFYLQRGNYISYLQSIGAPFSKSQAEHYIDKRWLVALDWLSSIRSGFANMQLWPGEALFSGPKVEYICKQYPDLDYILIPEYFSELAPVTSLSLKVNYTGHLHFFLTEKPIVDPTIYVYDCSTVRHMTNSASLSE